MPNANGLPTTGEEVQFADGTTGTIKRYMRSRVIGYQDSVEPLEYSDDRASVPVTGHIVEMAKPCRHEFVTVLTYLPSGFWQAMDPATTVSAPAPTMADVQYDGTAADKHLFRRLLTPVLVRTFLAGLAVGVAVTYLGCILAHG